MSNYQFWDELDKIFNAVVAYQEKSIEFNKRFINPWISLGNVFDKQDRNREAIEAYQKAIELDPNNAQTWCDLGSAYFRSAAYDRAVDAFQRAIELNPQLGWPYSNLALAYVTQDNHEQAIFLYQKSIELLKENKDKAVSWNRLGNLYRKLNEYGLAVQAFQKADELDHENAGFRDELDDIPQAAVTTGSQPAQVTAQAETIASPIQLIVQESQAEEAALAAGPVDAVASASAEENLSGEASDDLPEKTEQPLISAVAETSTKDQAAEPQAMEAEPVADADPVQTADQMGRLPDELVVEVVTEVPAAVDETSEQPVEVAPQEEPVVEVEQISAEPASEPAAEAPSPVAEPSVEAETPVTVQPIVETYTDSLIVVDTATETTDLSLPVEQPVAETPDVVEEALVMALEPAAVAATGEPIVPTAEATTSEIPVEEPAAAEPEAAARPVAEMTTEPAETEPEIIEPVAEQLAQDQAAAAELEAQVEPVAEEAAEPAEPEMVEPEAQVEPVAEGTAKTAEPEIVEPEAQVQPVTEEAAEWAEPEAAVIEPAAQDASSEAEAAPEEPTEEISQHAAYEEFLKDDGEALNVLTVTPAEEPVVAEQPVASAEPVTKIDASGEFQIEMDTKNAHVWNELGNVYFNNGAVDDSIVAYSKAIELDRWFAWPYSNLALAYVQKGRFAEAILLYQRSIELFTGEKDKAVSWNRLGNVYRRLNDYDNAIAAYQRADELDPDNATLSLQSRFSLLGSYQMEQNAGYAA